MAGVSAFGFASAFVAADLAGAGTFSAFGSAAGSAAGVSGSCRPFRLRLRLGSLRLRHGGGLFGSFLLRGGLGLRLRFGLGGGRRGRRRGLLGLGLGGGLGPGAADFAAAASSAASGFDGVSASTGAAADGAGSSAFADSAAAGATSGSAAGAADSGFAGAVSGSGSVLAWCGTDFFRPLGAALSNAAETRSAALSAGVGAGTVAEDGEVVVAVSVRSDWGGTDAAVDSVGSDRSRPNTLRSKLRMPMCEAFRMS